ncbi:glycosyltransferase family 4 protein [bacterium]|nr:glycosyltransferase family 4 protein [bacterium]
MRIGIYIDVLKQAEQSGIARHVAGLLRALGRVDKENDYILYYGTTSSGDPDLSEKYDFGPNFSFRRLPLAKLTQHQRPRIWWGLIVPVIATFDRIDVFHGPNFFIPTRGHFKRVVTIHDLAFFHMDVHGPGMDRIMREWTLKSLDSAHKVIAVSESTSRDCVAVGTPPDKLVTIYQGFEDGMPNLGATAELDLSVATGVPTGTPLILYVGTLQPRKNIPVLVKAFAAIKDQTPHQLVLAGAKGDSFEDITTLINQLGANDRITITGYVDDATRATLYQAADIFVYPSLYEGFGLVLLEAMNAGLPTIAAENSSLTEAGGDATKYFDTHSIESLSEVMLEVLGSEEVRRTMIERGHAHTQRFSWDEAARQHIELYKAALWNN